MLVLMRHGQSSWNHANRFSGWADIGLTIQGEQEAAKAGAALSNLKVEFDVVFTSVLKRSVRTAWILLGEAQQHWVRVIPNWALNERHYGALTGMSKLHATETLGRDAVMKWRRSWSNAPPPIEEGHPLFHDLVDRRYSSRDGAHSVLPSTESLSQVTRRAVDYYENEIVPAMRRGERPLIVAHAHTIRGLVKHLDSISDIDIEKLVIPTGTPLIYSLDRVTLKPVSRRIMTDDPHILADTLIERPGGGVSLIENSEVVPTHTISDSIVTDHGEGSTVEGDMQPIKVCNRTWRVVSGPGVTEDLKLLAQHRSVVDEWI